MQRKKIDVMGVMPNLFSVSSWERGKNDPPPNPNPTRFIIKSIEEKGPFLIVVVEYLDCTNFEGRKILVFEGVTRHELLSCQVLDPHFTNTTGVISPIARFVPTEHGKILARAMVEGMNSSYSRMW